MVSVRLRKLLFRQQDDRYSSTADEAMAMGGKVKRIVEKASSHAPVGWLCDDDELRVLKSFFDDL